MFLKNQQPKCKKQSFQLPQVLGIDPAAGL